MQRTARTLRTDLEADLGRAVAAGGLWGVVAIGFISVAREGIETALFLWSTVRSLGGSPGSLLGAVLGLLVAATLGWLIYRGLVRINLRTFFTWTAALLIVVAAGVLAYGDPRPPGGGRAARPVQRRGARSIRPPARSPSAGRAFPFGWAFQLGHLVPPDSAVAAILQGDPRPRARDDLAGDHRLGRLSHRRSARSSCVASSTTRSPATASSPDAAPLDSTRRDMKPSTSHPAIRAVALSALLVLGACVANTPAGGDAIAVTSTETACDGRDDQRRERHRRIRRPQRWRAGHRVLPARRGRAADHRRGREHRAGRIPDADRDRAAGRLLHAVQARHDRRRASGARRSPSPANGSRSPDRTPSRSRRRSTCTRRS